MSDRPIHPADFVKARMEQLGVNKTKEEMLRLHITPTWIERILRRQEELPARKYHGLLCAIATALRLEPATLRQVQDDWNAYACATDHKNYGRRDEYKRQARLDGRT